MMDLSEAIQFARLKSKYYKHQMKVKPWQTRPRIYYEQFRELYLCLLRIQGAKKKANKYDELELYLDANNLSVDQVIKIAKVYEQFKDDKLLKEIDKVISFFCK